MLIMNSLAEKVDPQHAAVVIIDMQNDFCHPEGRVGRSGQDTTSAQAIVGTVNNLIQEARSANVPVIFVRFIQNDYTVLRRAEQYMRDETGELICGEGTWGAEWYGILPQPGDAIVEKPRFSAFYGTNFETILRTRGIETLILSGTWTHICVETTARDAFMRDYYTVVLSDCTAAPWEEAHQRGLMDTYGDRATSDEVIAVWQKSLISTGVGKSE